MRSLQGTGIVLAHGKWDRPPFAVAPLADRLRRAGCTVSVPELPWSLGRLYDADFDAALTTLCAAADALRAAGHRRLLLGGHSLGANAALAAAARCPELDGLIVLAPGHLPERMHADGLTTASLARARAALASGAGGRLALVDSFLGQPRRLRFDPARYLGYFDPEGAAVLPANCRRLARALPLLWLVGRADPHFALGSAYAYAHAPAHAASAYVEIDAGHADTPSAAADTVTAWLHRHFAD